MHTTRQEYKEIHMHITCTLTTCFAYIFFSYLKNFHREKIVYYLLLTPGKCCSLQGSRRTDGEKQRCRIEIDSIVIHFSTMHHVCICLFPVLVLSFSMSYRFSPALTLPLHCISNCSLGDGRGRSETRYNCTLELYMWH